MVAKKNNEMTALEGVDIEIEDPDIEEANQPYKNIEYFHVKSKKIEGNLQMLKCTGFGVAMVVTTEFQNSKTDNHFVNTALQYTDTLLEVFRK